VRNTMMFFSNIIIFYFLQYLKNIRFSSIFEKYTRLRFREKFAELQYVHSFIKLFFFLTFRL